jgi:hypothetical protein
MEAQYYCDTTVNFIGLQGCDIPEDGSTLHSHFCENFVSNMYLYIHDLIHDFF